MSFMDSIMGGADRLSIFRESNGTAGLIAFALLLVGVFAWQKRKSTSVRTLIHSARSAMATLLACGAFLVVGPTLMMLNKHLMDNLHFNHPIAICSFGMVSSFIVSQVLVLCGLAEIREESRAVVAGTAWFRVAMPIGLLKALTMSSGNAVYLHLSFGFIQMLKAFTPLVVLVVMRITGVRLPTRAAMWCVVGIVAGTMVEVKGELHCTLIGLFLMLSSEVWEAMSVVMSQKILQNHKFTVLEGLYVISPAGAACLLAGVLIFEAPAMIKQGHHLIPLQHPVAFGSAAALGVGINFISLLVMQLTSALTMKILNTARSVALVAVGVVFYGEEHPFMQLCGYAIALSGFAGYNFFQMYPNSAKIVEARVDGCCSRALFCCPSRHRRRLRALVDVNSHDDDKASSAEVGEASTLGKPAAPPAAKC